MRSILLSICIVAAVGCAPSEEVSETAQEGTTLGIAADVAERLEQYAPTEMTADLSSLSDEDREVLRLLISASRPMDEIFLRQVWADNPSLRADLEASTAPNADASRSASPVAFDS